MAAALAPAAAQGQALNLQTWTCNATNGEVVLFRIGPGEFRTWNPADNAFSSNWCERENVCFLFQKQLHVDDRVKGVNYLFQLDDPGFLYATRDRSLNGPCRVAP